MGKWTAEGFVAKPKNDYTYELQELFKDCFGSDFVLDPTLPQGIFITRLAELLHNADMDGIEAFSRLNINTTTGTFLDVLGNLRNLPRSQGEPQKVSARLTVNSKNFVQFSIPKGHKFTTLDKGMTFVMDETQTITSAATDNIVSLSFTSVGDSGVSIGAKLATSEFDQIKDIEVISLAPGRELETDIEYRTRILRAIPVANNTIQVIENLLRQEQSIHEVGHNYNDTDEEKDTLPPYTTEFMVVPKSDVNMGDEAVASAWKTNVANIILNNKVPGTPTAGNTIVDNATDVFGDTKTVKFTIPKKVSLQITAELGTPEETGRFDMTRIDVIRKQMFDYVNNLIIGADVSYSRLVAPLAADTGFDILTFEIKDKETGATVNHANFPIGHREYANIALADIRLGNGIPEEPEEEEE